MIKKLGTLIFDHFPIKAFLCSWKKTRTRTSLMDRQARKLTAVREDGGFGEENFPEAGSEEETAEVRAGRDTIVIGQSAGNGSKLGCLGRGGAGPLRQLRHSLPHHTRHT